jgi:hypothetical protein
MQHLDAERLVGERLNAMLVEVLRIIIDPSRGRPRQMGAITGLNALREALIPKTCSQTSPAPARHCRAGQQSGVIRRSRVVLYPLWRFNDTGTRGRP